MTELISGLRKQEILNTPSLEREMKRINKQFLQLRELNPKRRKWDHLNVGWYLPIRGSHCD